MAWNDLLSGTTVVGASYFLTGGQGATLASADSIAVTDSFHAVTGSTTINTITGGVAGMGLFLLREAGETWALGSGGNIKASSSTPTDRVVFLVTPDGTTWYGDSQGVSVVSASNDIVVSETGGTYTLTFTPANVTLDEFTGPLAIAKGGSGQTTATAAFDALAPTTTTGDVIYFNGTDNIRLAVGATGTVLVGGTNPSYTATPTVTSITTAAGTAAAPGVQVVNDKGLYEIGTDELGIAVNGVGRLSLDATDLSPVTSGALALGTLVAPFKSVYGQDDRGYRNKTIGAGTTTLANFPLVQGDGLALLIEMAGVGTGTGPNYSTRQAVYQLAAYNNAGTIAVAASQVGSGAGVHTSVGAFNWNVFSAALADGAGDTVDLTVTASAATGTITSITMTYKIFWTYGDSAVTEV